MPRTGFFRCFHSWVYGLLAILLLIGLAGCGNRDADPTVTTPAEAASVASPTPTATTIPATATPTPRPTDTPTATLEPTATATATPTHTPTPLPTATATPSPTATSTPASSPTPAASPTPRPTAVPPTPTPAAAHTFPETPIQPFNADTLMNNMGMVRDSFRSFASEMNLWQTTGKFGDCGTFNGWTSLWILRAPGFTDVPSTWQALYVEYRSLLLEVVTITTEIRSLCSGQGGTVSAEATQAIIDFLGWAYPRSEQMVLEMAALPRP